LHGEKTNAGILLRISADHLDGLVDRAVIDDDELKISERLAQDALDRLVDVPFHVVRGHEDGDGWRRAHLFQYPRMAQINARHDSTLNGEVCQAANAYFLAMDFFPSLSAFQAQFLSCLSFGKRGLAV